MSACDQSRFYVEWRQLTEAEGHAIETNDWERVAQLQTTKATLQGAILDAERRDGPRTPGDTAALRAVLGDLVRLETRNRDRVAHHRQIAETQRAALDRSRANLKRLQQQFAIRPASGWQRYS